MIIVKLQGGLGNQMFQYAFGACFADKHQTELKFDASYLLDRSIKSEKHVFRDFDLSIFGITQSFATKKEIDRFKNRVGILNADKILNKLVGLKKTYVREPHYNFSQKVFDGSNNVYLEGYFQSEKYFAPIKDYIKQKFTVKDRLSTLSESLASDICSGESVCVNIRRGDFAVSSFHGTLPAEYYSNAEKLILQKVSSPHLYVFSDDLDWCRQNLKFKSPVTFVSHDYAGNKFQDYLRLMSYCKYFIIPNSTFAWWAAYLSNNPNKLIITPKKWYNDPEWDTKDLLPDEWIKVDGYNF